MIKNSTSQKNGVVKAMLEIKNQKLYIDGKAIGNEERLLHLFDKAIKYDECKSIFEELKEENRRFKAKNLALTKKLQNVTLWDLSPEAQEEAGHALAKSLLGGA